ncbi:hypothetical protein O181_012109 [Austropuccinia psidii MF-1]|uniref:Uncharacterized protein n=1 Tax=Austropuccinia psidii MF-1 TaxID=1389203 RepID=A0A9Q3BU23_9BASI|nr:hypothetical protein [Austropuccinia psidii MF-1]
MNTRRGLQYSTQSDGVGLRSRIHPSKGKLKGKFPSGIKSSEGSAISQRKVPEASIISEKELELSLCNSNKYKSHTEGSNRHIHEPVQTVLHHVQGQGLGNFATDPPRRDELLVPPESVPQRGGNSKILKWMESTITQTSNQKGQGVPYQKKEESKEEAIIASTSKPQVRKSSKEGKKKKKIVG